MPITPWPYYADHLLALICRSRLGSYMPVGDKSTEMCSSDTEIEAIENDVEQEPITFGLRKVAL